MRDHFRHQTGFAFIARPEHENMRIYQTNRGWNGQVLLLPGIIDSPFTALPKRNTASFKRLAQLFAVLSVRSEELRRNIFCLLKAGAPSIRAKSRPHEDQYSNCKCKQAQSGAHAEFHKASRLLFNTVN